MPLNLRAATSCFTIAFTLALALPPGATAAPVRHAPTGFVFPEKLAGFQRTRVMPFDRQSTNMGVNYRKGDATATIYVYPAAPSGRLRLNAHFEECREEIAQFWGSTKRISRRKTSLRRHGQTYPGLEEIFSGKPRGENRLISYLALFQRGPYYVKFRLTAPHAQHPQSETAFRAFVAQFPWPPMRDGRR